MYTLNCKGKLLSLHQPIVMGIVNVTPDSFYDQPLQQGIEAILAMADTLLAEGARILDIGGQSTKPNSVRINAAQEMDRVLPVIERLVDKYPDAILSIDTFSSEVATAAIGAGASMVNDVSGGNMDEAMIATVAQLNVPYICMHMKGTPQDMQQLAVYDDVVKEVLDFFIDKISACKAAGIVDLIIDPGFGFAKTAAHNFTLLKNLMALQMLNKPILAGLSRKSTIYKTLDTTSDKALNGTTVLNTIALLNGASILRVHDAKEAREAITLVNAYREA